MSPSPLLQGTDGLLLAYAAAWTALFITLVQRRAGLRNLLLSPLVALPCLLVGGLLASALGAVLSASATPAWLQPFMALAVLLFAGFAGGLLVTREHAAVS